MPKLAKPLTDYVVKTLKPDRGQAGWKEVSDGGCRGLLLRISPRGEKAWAVRLTVNGKRQLHTLGAYPTVTLADARSRVSEYVAAARDGASPEEVNAREEARAMTVKVAHHRYIAAVKSALSGNTVKLKEALFATHIEPVAGNRLLRKIRRADVVEVVEAVRAKGMLVQSNRVFSELMALLRWCDGKGWVDGVPNFHKFKAKEQRRARTLTDSELKDVWIVADQLGDLTGAFIKLLILTGQRRDEVRLMRWEEIDLDNSMWVIPATRYKTKVDQAVPLSQAAVDLLKARTETAGASGYVLAGRGEDMPFNGAASAMRRLRTKVAGKGDFTLHDLRRTLRTGLSRLGVDDLTAEMVIGHLPQGIQRVYDTYDRIDERRKALERWASYVMTVVGDRGCNVVALVKEAG